MSPDTGERGLRDPGPARFGSAESGRESERRCSNCGLPITWPSVLVDGVEYCCGGCALGGPCYCSYDEEEPKDMRPVEKPLPFTLEGKEELRLEIDVLERLRLEILNESRLAPEQTREVLRRELTAVEEQIYRLKEVLELGELVDNTGLVVAVGSEVTVETEYGRPTFVIGGPVIATPRRGCISYESPLGRALLGTELGDRVEVPWDGGRRRLRVVAIKRARLPDPRAATPPESSPHTRATSRSASD